VAKGKADWRVKNIEKENARMARYRIANKEKISKKAAEYRAANCERLALAQKVWRAANAEKIAVRRENNKEKEKAYGAKYRAENKEKIAARRATQKDKNAEYGRRYWKENKETLTKTNYERKVNRLKTDPEFKLREILRHRVFLTLKRQRTEKSYQSHIRLLGCTVAEARTHIESQFEPWMSWKNHGLHGWHIDHIKPLAAFDLSDAEQAKQAFHYTNLRPLHWRANIQKGARLT